MNKEKKYEQFVDDFFNKKVDLKTLVYSVKEGTKEFWFLYNMVYWGIGDLKRKNSIHFDTLYECVIQNLEFFKAVRNILYVSSDNHYELLKGIIPLELNSENFSCGIPIDNVFIKRWFFDEYKEKLKWRFKNFKRVCVKYQAFSEEDLKEYFPNAEIVEWEHIFSYNKETGEWSYERMSRELFRRIGIQRGFEISYSGKKGKYVSASEYYFHIPITINNKIIEHQDIITFYEFGSDYVDFQKNKVYYSKNKDWLKKFLERDVKAIKSIFREQEKILELEEGV